jgi:hypothetical protein
MKTSLKCVLILITLAVCAASSTQSATPPFALTLEAEENPVKAGSEVRVDITLSNSSNRAMHISYGASEVDYAFEVRDSQNRIPLETEFARKSKGKGYFSNDHVFYLQPGESLPKAPLVVSKFYDLSRPEEYKIQVSRAVPKELGGGTIKSNAITITITASGAS